MSNWTMRLQIQHAQEQLTTAQRALEEAMQGLRVSSTADKTHVGDRIARAFDTVMDAKKHLDELEKQLASDLSDVPE